MIIPQIVKTPGIVNHAHGWFIVSGGTIHAGQVYSHWQGRAIVFVDGHVAAGGNMYGLRMPTSTVTHYGRDVATGLRVSIGEDGIGCLYANRHQRKRLTQIGVDCTLGLACTDML